MRIIAGRAKGREILAPKGKNTRPTLAKVKEAMFGMIQFDLEDAFVLDLFAGSGGLGIEALSRGASKAVFCDLDIQAVKVIKGNLSKLGFEEQASVRYGDSLNSLKQLAAKGAAFDIVFIDPPYCSDLAGKALELLGELPLLNPGAILLCEHSKDNPPSIPHCFNPRKPKKYGDTYVTLAVYEGE